MHRLPVVRHRTANQAWAKYRSCRHPVEKTRWHLVWLLLRADEPRTPAQAAAVVGVSVSTARAVLHRWNADGPGGLADRRAGNRGRPRLTGGQRAALLTALKKRPPDGGLWTGPKVAAYVRDRWGVSGRPRTGWRWLVALGFSLQVPRPSHPPRRPPAVEKNLRQRLARLRRAHPGRRVEVWAEDEARLGLKPVTRRVWSLQGRRPVRRAGPVRLAVRVRVRPPGDRADVPRVAPAGERRPDGRRPGRLRRSRRPGRDEGAGGAGGQRRLARGQAAGRTGERGVALPAAMHPRAPAGSTRRGRSSRTRNRFSTSWRSPW